MTYLNDLLETPQSRQSGTWLESLIVLCQEQAHIIQTQSEEIVQCKQTIQELRDELNRLKKQPKRPKFRPGRNFKNNNGKGSAGISGSLQRTTVPRRQEEIIVRASGVPNSAVFKGYQRYSIQELELLPKDVIYKLEVWQVPGGEVFRAALPKDIEGSHFGSTLRSLIFNLSAEGMTQPALFNFLCNMGIDISEGQIHNILMQEVPGLQQVSEKILEAGLQESPYIRTDDTGAKHQHKAAYCTHIGGQYFAYYKTGFTKSRENFLNILLQGKKGYTINQASIWHMFQGGVEDDLLNAFEDHIGKHYATTKGLNHLLNEMGIQNKKIRAYCIEAALIGFVQETILKPDQVLLSDRAGQFAVFDHAACWIHMERPLRKLPMKTQKAEKELEKVRTAIWDLYDQLKEASLSQRNKEAVHNAFDALVAMKVTSPGIQAVLDNFEEYREELLKALDHPGLPLHNNDSERDIRAIVKMRNISGSTKSSQGQAFRDGLITLKQTCFRLGLSFWEYLNDWFRRKPPDLGECIRERYRTACNAMVA